MSQTPDYRAGFRAAIKAAIKLLDDETDALLEIRDSYIAAQTTGRMDGRRIRKEFAKDAAGKFRERAEAVHQMIEHVAKLAEIERELTAREGGGEGK